MAVVEGVLFWLAWYQVIKAHSRKGWCTFMACGRIPSLRPNQETWCFLPWGRQRWDALQHGSCHVGKDHTWGVKMLYDLEQSIHPQVTTNDWTECTGSKVLRGEFCVTPCWHSQKSGLWEPSLRREKKELWGFPTPNESLQLYFHRNLEFRLNLTKFS